MSKLYILLGGNLGDKRKIFSETILFLKEKVGKITKQSSVYQTEPWGFDSDDFFWNQVIEIVTELSPEEVLHITQEIEIQLGRVRKTDRYDSRLIDIDILFYEDRIIESEKLIVPHPRLQERKFALIPLSEIAPEMVHPVFHKNIRQLLAESADSLKVEKVSNLPGYNL